ncbi:MAG: hypothetical protein GX585_05690, partial [Clostridiales bacterium]|nr:hypothetical protein [Clostridiales bacterium]
ESIKDELIEERARELAFNDGMFTVNGGIAGIIEALDNSFAIEGIDIESVRSDLEDLMLEGAYASEVIKRLKENSSLLYVTDYEGNLVTNEAIRMAFEDSGYDGFIDTTVSRKFGPNRFRGRGMDGIKSDTIHYIAFSPTQIKSVNNQGTWDAGNPNILASIEYRVGLDQVKTMLRNGGYPSDRDLELHKGDPAVDWEIQFRRVLNQDATLVELFQDAYDKLLVELETKEVADENARLLELIEESSTSKIDLQEETGDTARFLERMKQQVSYMTSSEADSQFASRLNDNSYVLEVATKLTEDMDITRESDISPYIVRLANHDNPVDYTYRMARQALRAEKTRYRQMFFEQEGLAAQLSYEDATAGQQTFSRYENNEVRALLSSATGEDIKAIVRKGLATESVLDTLIAKMNEDIKSVADELGTTVEQVEILMRWIEEGDTEYKRRNSLYLKLQDINKNNRDKYNKLKRSVQRKTDALKAKNAMQKLLRQGQSIVLQTPNYDANVMHDLNGFWNIMRSTIGKDNDLTGLFSHEGVIFKHLPEPLKQFFEVRDDGIFFVKKLNNMTIGELQYLKDTMRDVKAAAKELVHDRRTEQIRRVGPTVQKALAAAYGVNAGSFLEARSEFSDIKADSVTKWKKTARGMIETQFLTMSRLIDKIDPSGALKSWVFGKNGVDKIVADEQRKQGERYDAARKEMDRLGVNMKDLDKEFIKLPRSNGEEVITVDRAVGIYIYSQQADGLEKLISANGNKLKQQEIDMILDKLPDKYKAWGDYLIQDMTSRHDAIADVYYNVKNKKLGYIAKYFPLVRGADEAKFDDMLEEEHFSRPQNPADSFTYKRQGGDYALALDATNVWYRMVHKQEHYISAAQWVNDTQYMLRKGGGDLKSAIGISKGQQYAQAFEDFVNRFAHRYHVYDTADTFINNIRSNLIVARLGFNIITAFKQIPSLMYFTAKFGPIRLIESLGQVIFHYKETSQKIYELSPQLKNRRFSNEFDLVTQMAGKSAYQKTVKTIGKVGMSPIEFMDRMVVNTLWLGAYNANIAKGMDSESAALDATRFIADTQPGGSVVDTAAIYSSDSTLAKFLLMFSSQLNKNFNMIYADIPSAFKQHLYGKALSYTLGLGLSFAGILLASGSFADKDDDERDILRLFASQLANQLPVIGNRVAPIISGDYFASEDTLIIPEVNSLMSAFKSGDEKRILDRWVKLGLSVGEVSGLPSGMGTKLYNTAFKEDDINLGYILNSGWAEAFTE